MDSTQLLEQGRRAFDRRAWPEAEEHLTAAARAGRLEPDDLERLARAAFLSGHDEASVSAWTRAHQARLDRGEHAAAVRCAFWAGFGLVQRGEMAQGSGWFARARSLCERHDLDCVERGYLLVPEGLMAIHAGDLDSARERFGEAAALAQRFGDPDLAAFGALGRGEALLRAGRGAEAMRLLDEAMVSVTAGETSPAVSGIVYCAVIDACQRAFDLRRAREWTLALDRWCAGQPGLVPYQGQCLVHRAQILQVQGDWRAALTEATRACERLADPPHPAIGMAYYELAEIHRLRGELRDAEAAYRQAHAWGRQPQPGLALLRLAEGRLDAAVAASERAVGDAGDDVTRARLLPGHVEVLLAASRSGDARTAAGELTAVAERLDTDLVRAVAAGARGAVLLAEGDPAGALEALHDARCAWQAMDAPYEAARIRVLIAEACAAVGDHDTAELERDAARGVFERLGAAPDLARLDGAGDGPSAALPVTARELEVLRLVAAGRTNRGIAESLAISERTVERHLGNIFTKLDVPNRAAATAYAYDHDLV